jgi:hypothetical protein
VEQKPYCVMARAALERMLAASRLDEVFRTHARFNMNGSCCSRSWSR